MTASNVRLIRHFSRYSLRHSPHSSLCFEILLCEAASPCATMLTTSSSLRRHAAELPFVPPLHCHRSKFERVLRSLQRTSYFVLKIYFFVVQFLRSFGRVNYNHMKGLQQGSLKELQEMYWCRYLATLSFLIFMSLPSLGATLSVLKMGTIFTLSSVH